jgi:hypothetical protein
MSAVAPRDMTGLRKITEQDCVRIVDDFLAAHRREAEPEQQSAPAD